MTPLTDQQRDVLAYIAQHINRRGFQPSYREIAEHFGWASAAYVTVLVSRMENKGWVARMGSRAIEFEWKHYLKEFSNDAARTDGSSHRTVPGRNLRRGRKRRSHRLHRTANAP